MHKLRTLLPALALAATLHAQADAQLTPLQDPANLAGERVAPQDPADTLPLNHGAPALQQLLAKLRTRASLMLIVAHPDDEDGGLLTFESRGQGARVAMLTLTRGEGGQNLMSADFDDALGLIRTQELLAADRYFGVDQFFGTEVDFGFSKTKEETLAKWTHDRVLYDAVRAVRLYRPLVLASVFVGGPTDGHGQHQVAGEIAQEVFLAAADPKVFPEMGLPVWAPLKVYARVPFSRVTPDGMYDYATGRTIPTRFHNYVTGADTTTVPAATVQIHEGDKPSDPTLAAAMGGDTFLQFARKGLALQKTQIGNTTRLPPAGAFDAPYTLMASRVSSKPATEQSLFDGIDTTLPGLATLTPNAPATLRATLESIDKQLAEAQRLFDPAHLDRTAPLLREALRTLDTLLTTTSASTLAPTEKENLLHELRIKRVQLNNALVLALGIKLNSQLFAQWAGPSLVPGDMPGVGYSIQDLSGLPVMLKFVTVESPWDHQKVQAESEPSQRINFLLNNDRKSFDLGRSAQIPFSNQETHPLTRPYFSRTNIEQPFYDLSNTNLRNAPTSPYALAVMAHLDTDGVPLAICSVVNAPNTQPITIVPRISLQISPAIGIFSVTASSNVPLQFTAKVLTNAPNGEGRIGVTRPEGWVTNFVGQEFVGREVRRTPDYKLAKPGDYKDITFSIQPPSNITATRSTTLKVGVRVNPGPQIYNEGYRPVGYPGLPYTNFYTPATYRATAVDLQTAPNLRIAYLPGTGDPTPDFLPNLGITPTILTLKDLTPATLNQYDAVLVGVRAYAALPALAGPGSQPLLDYAKQGGVVILQYMTARYGDAEAPFPIGVPGDSAHNVVEEAQPVTLLHPGAPLLTWPNKITPADFDHWVAERGHGFAATWSPSYTPLLETHDVGQDPQQGGLLLARTGKGAYIYCALALYRQLPEGVPGAYRLLANLLSYAKNPNIAR